VFVSLTSVSDEILSFFEGEEDKISFGRIPSQSITAHTTLPLRTSSPQLLCKRLGRKMTILAFGVGAVVFGALAYVMVKEYVKFMSIDDDIEEYGGDRTRIRHEEGI
jgi:hypothetical protein